MAIELFDDEKLPFAVRVEILYATVAGSCRNTRRCSSASPPSGRIALAAARRRAGSADPAMGPMLGLMPALGGAVREQPRGPVCPSATWPAKGGFDFLLPESVAARSILCQHSFYVLRGGTNARRRPFGVRQVT